jgi:transcriptional regulator with XRE-family HTH domain
MEVNFGKLLKSMRMDRGLTQAKLAEMCGVTQSTIGVWENGVNVPSVENLYALTKALNLQPGILRAAVNGEPPRASRHHAKEPSI